MVDGSAAGKSSQLKTSLVNLGLGKISDNYGNSFFAFNFRQSPKCIHPNILNANNKTV